MCKLAISLLEMNYKQLEQHIKETEMAGVDYIHIDVMDGNFVPSLGIGIKIIQSIRESTNMIFDVHMMVQEAGRFVDKLVRAGADVITIHYEACKNVKETLAKIRALGVVTAIAINPDTPIEVLDEGILNMVDVVHLMTVYPGRENQSFIPQSLERILKLRHKMKELGLETDIEVDGNITMDNVELVVKAGATIIVSGRALAQGNVVDNVRKMKEKIQSAEKRKGYEICNWC